MLCERGERRAEQWIEPVNGFQEAGHRQLLEICAL
jgi:hypothetical protein